MSDREQTILQIQSLQETTKDLLARLATVKANYDAGVQENEMLVKYIANLKSGASGGMKHSPSG